MSNKTLIETNMLVPKVSDCEACLARLEARVQRYRGIEVAHIDRDGDSPRICVHYDPNLVNSDYVRAIATEEGAHLQSQFRHKTLEVAGLDCADCARTLEAGVGRLHGVLWASVSFPSSKLALEFDSDVVDLAGVISRIEALGYDVPGAPAHVDTVYDVDGLDCADCALHLEEAVRRTPGIRSVSVDFALARMRVTSSQDAVTEPALEQVARDMGYAIRPRARAAAEGTPRSSPSWRRRFLGRKRDLATASAGLLLLVAVTVRLLGAPEAVVGAVFVSAIVAGGYPVARAGWASLRTARSLDMNALMSIAAIGAVFVGEWAEGAVAIFLFSLGNTLEGYTMDRARNAIRELMVLSPREALRLQAGAEQMVPVEELRVGDRILVRPGERVPMDGVILAGSSAIDEAPITGESVPIDKAPGQEVYAGTVNGQGALTLRITHLAGDTTIARIIKMVEEAQAQKAPSQRFVDRFARIYTPVVIAVAATIAILPPVVGALAGAGPFQALFGDWVYRALVLLVIACPCALVISTPVSIVSAIASAARSGVLIKGGTYLEALGEVRVIAFDKTGTLTTGKPQVVELRCVDHVPGKPWRECSTCMEMLADATAVERRSQHPLAAAVVEEAKALGLEHITAADSVEVIAGNGVRGQLGGLGLTVGRHDFIHQEDPNLCRAEFCDAVDQAAAAGRTIMVVRDDLRGVRGYIAVSDALRPGTTGVIEALVREGIERTVMLTGDNEAMAQAVGRAAGLHEVQSGLLPQDKVAAVETLLQQHKTVAMVGDGVNDAPALARASVGIAMGAAGTDTALETADVALMADDLGRLPFAVRLGRSARRTILQNIVLSLAIKAVFLALALGGVATLWMAVFADMGSSLIVTLNGMRLLRQK